MTTALWIAGAVVFVVLLVIWPGFRWLMGQIVYAIFEQLRYMIPW